MTRISIVPMRMPRLCFEHLQEKHVDIIETSASLTVLEG